MLVEDWEKALLMSTHLYDNFIGRRWPPWTHSSTRPPVLSSLSTIICTGYWSRRAHKVLPNTRKLLDAQERASWRGIRISEARNIGDVTIGKPDLIHEAFVIRKRPHRCANVEFRFRTAQPNLFMFMTCKIMTRGNGWRVYTAVFGWARSAYWLRRSFGKPLILERRDARYPQVQSSRLTTSTHKCLEHVDFWCAVRNTCCLRRYLGKKTCNIDRVTFFGQTSICWQ